jgi:hypothetical protein
MSSSALRCKHIKVSGTRCGSPALRQKSFCFYHQQNRPISAECYYKADEYSTGDIILPPFEDAHSIQTVIRQIMQMVLQKRLEQKTASLMLYALQIASSNLKRIEAEKPQPADVVTDPENMDLENPDSKTFGFESAAETFVEAESLQQADCEANAVQQPEQNQTRENKGAKAGSEELSPGTFTIQACYRPGPPPQNRARQRPTKQYVI